MPEYFAAPEGGRIRISDGLTEPEYADAMTVIPRGQEVEILLMHAVDEALDDEGDVVGEVVARVFMGRANYETLVGMLPEGLAAWRRMGL